MDEYRPLFRQLLFRRR